MEEVCKLFCKFLNIKKLQTIAYNPQANAAKNLRQVRGAGVVGKLVGTLTVRIAKRDEVIFSTF